MNNEQQLREITGCPNGLELVEHIKALVAENVALKAAIDATVGWQQSTDAENVESVRMLVDIPPPPPTTSLPELRLMGWRLLLSTFSKSLKASGISGCECWRLNGSPSSYARGQKDND